MQSNRLCLAPIAPIDGERTGTATLSRSLLVGVRFFFDDAKEEAIKTAEELLALYPYERARTAPPACCTALILTPPTTRYQRVGVAHVDAGRIVPPSRRPDSLD